MGKVKPVVGTLQYHSFKPSDTPGSIVAAKTSHGDDATVFKLFLNFILIDLYLKQQ